MGIFPERIFAFTFFLASAVGALGARLPPMSMTLTLVCSWA